MAMFGTKPADPNGLHWFTPLDAPPTSVAQPNVTPIATTDVPAAPKPGFFGKGGVGRAIVGNIADGILQTMGQQPTYRLAMEHQRDLEEQRQQALANLGNQFQLWQEQQRFKAQNPAPTAFEQDLTAAGIDPTSEQGRSLYQRYVTNKADPFQAVPGVDAQGNQVLRFLRPSQMNAPSAPAVGTIDSGYRFTGGDPSDPRNWQPVEGGDPASGGGAGLTTPRPFR